MKKLFIPFLIVSFCTFSFTKVKSQCAQSNFTNPSFEGTAQPHALPPSWSNCNGTTSDTQPGSWGITNPASNGSTWAGLVSVPGWQETASQIFTPCLVAGQTYNFTVDVIKVDETSDGGGDCDGYIQLWGGDGSGGSACDQDVILWVGPTLVTNGPNQNNWITNTISFTPTQTICQITFQAIGGNCPTGTGDFYCGIDNITPIQPNIAVTPSVVQNVSCFGGNDGSVTANVTTGGTPPFTYSWNPGGPGQTITNCTAGNYVCTVTDGAGCTVTGTVTVTEPPVVNINLVPVAANCGTGGSITTTVTGGTAPFTFSWSPGGSTAQDPTNLVPGTYTVTVTGGGPCTYTASTVVGNGGAAIASFTQSPDQCLSGNLFNFTNTGTTGGGTTFDWSFPGANIPSTTLENPTGISWSAAGTYVVSFTVTAGACSTVTTGTVNVNNDLAFSVSGNDTICNGANTTWSLAGPPATYTWNPGTLTGTSQTLSPASTTTYTVDGIDANGCANTITFTVSVAPTMTLAIGGFPVTCNAQCDGQAVVLVTPSTGPFAQYNYLWSNAGTTASIGSLCAANYTVTVTDFAGCVASTTVTVTEPTAVTAAASSITNATCNNFCDGSVLITPGGGTGTYTYTWLPAGAGNNPTNLCDATYSVTVEDANGCPANVNFTITEPAPITASIAPVVGLCQGQTATLNATGGGGNAGYVYTWTAGTTPGTGASVTASPTVTTSYTVSITDANNCPAATASVTVNVASPLSVVASADVTICDGAVGSLSAVASGGDGVYTYNWTPATNPATGPAVTSSPNTTTTYTVTVTDGCGTPSANDQVVINVNPLPVISYTTSAPNNCAPWCVDFSVTSAPTLASADWLFTNGTASASSTPNVCFADSGSYGFTVNVVDVNGCANVLTQANVVNVYPNPDAAFTFGPQPTTELEGTIFFTDLSQGSNITNWVWTFGNPEDSSSTLQNPQFTYTSAGTYIVQLAIANTWGCVDTVTETVVIEQDFTFFAPNAFTPNEDGRNDVFFTKGIGIDTENFQLWIYDRWGNMIFYTNDFFQTWDGKVQGGAEIVQQDTYVWKVKLQDFKERKHSYVGHVTVIK